MSLAAQLFFSSDASIETLHSRITPTEVERSSQVQYWSELAESLIHGVREKVGFPFKTWIQGSYKFGTQIRPPSQSEHMDIDLGLYMLPTRREDAKLSAAYYREIVNQVLKELVSSIDGAESVGRPKEKCERVHYEENFHIDIPCYIRDSVSFESFLATKSDIWESSDPKDLVVWFRKEVGNDDDRAQVRRLIRYFKMWMGLNVPDAHRLSSIALTVLIAECYPALPPEVKGDDEVMNWAVEQVKERLIGSKNIANPVDPLENLNRLSDKGCDFLIGYLANLEQISRRALGAASKLETAIIWSEAFQHFFPQPTLTEIDEEALLAESRALVAIQRLNISVVARSKDGTGPIFSGQNRIGPIPKDCEIEFTLTDPLDWDVDVEWIVRNSGQEAIGANDLGHKKQSGRRAEEHSAYTGRHYMDCIAKRRGQVVGYQRVAVQVSQAVKRNRRRAGSFPRKHK